MVYRLTRVEAQLRNRTVSSLRSAARTARGFPAHIQESIDKVLLELGAEPELVRNERYHDYWSDRDNDLSPEAQRKWDAQVTRAYYEAWVNGNYRTSEAFPGGRLPVLPSPPKESDPL